MTRSEFGCGFSNGIYVCRGWNVEFWTGIFSSSSKNASLPPPPLGRRLTELAVAANKPCLFDFRNVRKQHTVPDFQRRAVHLPLVPSLSVTHTDRERQAYAGISYLQPSHWGHVPLEDGESFLIHLLKRNQ